MIPANKTVRQYITLPAKLAAQVRALAKTRKLTFSRTIVELIEKGIEAEQRQHQQDFFELVKHFRRAADPEESKRLGDKLGRMVFLG